MVEGKIRDWKILKENERWSLSTTGTGSSAGSLLQTDLRLFGSQEGDRLARLGLGERENFFSLSLGFLNYKLGIIPRNCED